jgi:hypothetical protein
MVAVDFVGEYGERAELALGGFDNIAVEQDDNARCFSAGVFVAAAGAVDCATRAVTMILLMVAVGERCCCCCDCRLFPCCSHYSRLCSDCCSIPGSTVVARRVA